MILDQDKVPRSPGFVSVGSRRYREWQNLALESTVEARSDAPEPIEDLAEPAVPRPTYLTPRSILCRPKSDEIDRDRSLVSTLESRPRARTADTTQIGAECPDPGRGCPSAPATIPNPDRNLAGDAEGGISESMPDQATDRTDAKDIEPKTEDQTQIILDQGQIKLGPDAKLPICPTEGVRQRDPPAEGTTSQDTEDEARSNSIPTQNSRSGLPRASNNDLPAEGPAATTSQDTEDEVEIYYHDSGDLSAEYLEGNLAVLPEIPISTTAEVSIEDLHVGDSGSATPEEIERLRQIIWKKRHLLIGKGNALPPAAKGVVCDIDVGNGKRIALRTRKVLMRFREKVAGLIKILTASQCWVGDRTSTTS
ncbi:Eukaryotic/viral aspartic protease [Phytophthora megakarya]|uniref:Eukaryotic/viral aspartic protease n=1 Tax=Phytophthora megakarya TaxID=4795 RepID=A0A225ULG1_9STRA|nr:Eukaryotic/viral aspartic protease [Phytophthora megakarya]